MNFLEQLRKHFGFSKSYITKDICNVRTYDKFSNNLMDAPLKFIFDIADHYGMSPDEIYHENQINLLINAKAETDLFRLRSIEMINYANTIERTDNKEKEQELLKLLEDFSHFSELKFKNPKYLNIYVLYNNYFPTEIFHKFPRIDFHTLKTQLRPIDEKQILEIEEYYWNRKKNGTAITTISDLQVFNNLFINLDLPIETFQQIDHYFLSELTDKDESELLWMSQAKRYCYLTILSNYVQYCIHNKFYEHGQSQIAFFNLLPQSFKDTDIQIGMKIFELILDFYLNKNYDSYLEINSYSQFLMEFANPDYAKSIRSLIITVLDNDHRDNSSPNNSFTNSTSK